MKKRLLALTVAGILFAFSACGNNASSQDKTSNKETSVEAEASGMTLEEFEQQLGVGFEVPEGIENVRYNIIEDEGTVGEVTFTKDGLDYTLRMKEGERPDHKLAGVDLEYDDWEYCYTATRGESYAGIMRGYDNGKTYDLAYMYYRDISWLYTILVTTGDHEGVEIEDLALSFADAHWNRVQEDIDNFSGMEAEQLPDGHYSSYCNYVDDISEENGVLRISFEKIYYVDGQIDGAPVDDWGMQFVPNISITGVTSEMECADLDVGMEFEANSDLAHVKNVIEKNMDYVDASCPGIGFEVLDGKIVKLWVVFS